LTKIVQQSPECYFLQMSRKQCSPKRSAIKVLRYGSREEEGRREQLAGDPLTIEGCVYKQIADAVETTKRIIEDVRTLTPQGLSPVRYPDETLHEISRL
jgi:ATP-dependent DNA helicase RecG